MEIIDINKFHCQWTRLLFLYSFCIVLFGSKFVMSQDESLSQEFYIEEEKPVGTVIGQIGTNIPEVSPPYMHYFNSNDLEEVIQVTTEGQVKIKGRMDREHRSQYQFVVVDLNSGKHIRVTIHVTDINDHSPTFPDSVVNITILESAPRDAKYFLGSALDPDLGDFTTARYEIVSGNNGDVFRLLSKRATNGVLLLDLAINGHLDYEETPHYTLVINAYDGASPPKVGTMTVNITIVDANDNSPIFNFTRYKAQVAENTTIGTSILQVFATDIDSGENGRISYHIDRQRSDPNENFNINSLSGEIFVNKKLDYEQTKAYELIVVARDNGTQKLQTTAIVSVLVTDVNDNAPVISLIFLTDDGTGRISETSQPGDPIARLSISDPDMEERQPVVNVSLTGGDGYFGLSNRDSVVYLVIISKPLDREIKPYYVLTVTATDSGSPPLSSTESFTVYVTDTNDNAPKFSQSIYYADIQEVISPGSSVIQLEAVDNDYGNNSMITYELLRTPDSHWEWFQVDNRTGLITTRTKVDCEMASEPRLQVVATDSGTPPLSTTVTVVVRIIDVNDNQPVFDQSFYNVSIREDAAVKTCILQVSATDPDCGANAQVRYAVAANLGFQFPSEFEVQPETGRICILRPLDYETKSMYDFPVVARDQDGLDTTALVMIVVQDVNDNAPVFYPSQYSVSVDLDTVTRDSEVVVVKATDRDSGSFGTVTYGIVGGNAGGIFRIDADTGVISIAGSPALTPTVYTLTVTATDGGGVEAVVRANVSISIRDASQNPPEFTSSLYRFTVSENATVSTLVGTVEATGNNVIYTIISGDPEGLFHLNPSTGHLRTEKELDHDTLASVLLNIQARAEGQNDGPPVYGNAQVNISITDVNDNVPQFAVSTVEIPIKEDVGMSNTVYVVHADDQDSGDNGQVRYALNDPSGTFAINTYTGEIRLLKPLDHETATRHEFVVRAYDMGKNSHQSTMTVVVLVQDVNDNAPIFEKESYEFSVSENREEKYKFGQVAASDGDSGNNGKIRFLIQNGQSVDTFGVFPDDGWLYNRVQLDRERRAQYKFTVVAVDNGVPPKSSSTQVTVTVQDANDNDPIFQESPYTFSIIENQPPHSLVGIISAMDKDQSDRLAYSIKQSNQYFTIDQYSGEILTQKQLDREEIEMHQFKVVVSDQGRPPRSAEVDVKVMVRDVNDNSPVFEQSGIYYAYINENQPKNTLVAQISARDSDKGENSTLTYSFQTEQGNHDQNMFTIHPSTGQITTNEILDHESKASYVLKVKAEDGGHPARSTLKTVEVIVEDQNESPPEFENAHVSFLVQENTAPGTIVGNVTARDADSGENGRVSYYIVRGNLFGTFGVNSTTGAVFVSRPVDFEECSAYSIQIRAVDSSTVNPMSSIINVNITIQDVNDNPPKFEENPVVISIRENIPVGTHIYTFTVIDQDSDKRGTIFFELVSQSPDGQWFSVDRETGYLRIKNIIDYEETTQISVVIRAVDQPSDINSRLSTTVSALILIEDVNDNAPQFQTRNEAHVLEDEPIGYPVAHVIATDTDSHDKGRVSYAIISGNEDNKFHLESSTGLLTIARMLDREKQDVYNLNISAHDYGLPRLTSYMLLSVYIMDVNDNPPKFQHSVYTANITENAAPDTLVVRIHATDPDMDINAQLSYLLPDGLAASHFIIDETTGEMRTKTTLDREEHDSWVITAYVKDGAFPALYDTTTILLTVEDENDNYPIFKMPQDYLEVPENAHMSIIHTVVASDLDEGDNGVLTYSIVGGNHDNKFSLDPRTGALSCSPLDRETTNLYNLTIAASDHGNPPKSNYSTILISVVDDNDNDPSFLEAEYRADIPEDIAVGTSVLKVQATDRDAGVNAQISYSMNNAAQGQFKINNVTGVLTTAGDFDREKVPHYSFEVYATDGGLYGPRSETVRVEITILDINDNSPVFSQIPYHAEISQDLAVNAIVVQVSAQDKDEGENGEITYSFPSPSQYFKIDAASGVVRTRSLLGPEAHGVHTLEVTARDQGNTPRSSTGLLEIQVGTTVSGTLRFTNLTYNVYLVENAAQGASVTRVQARFLDAASGRILYSFASGNEDNIFAIDQESGSITVQDGSKLDYETNPRLRLIVVATANSAYGYTTVWVNLKDVNDNAPKFTQQRYTSRVWEGNSRGTYVTQIIASDADEGENGEVTYSIIGGNTHGAFIIDPPNTGIVKTNIILDREILESYRLEVEAIDGGKNPLTSVCTLKIQIIDINDNAPFFPAYPPVNIKEGIERGSVIMEVTANDRDLNPSLHYQFAPGGNPHEAFSVDRYSGKITVAKVLDHEAVSVYYLRILASDNRHNATADITVNVLDENDNPPVFRQQSYEVSIKEMTGPSVPVLTVNATDRDSGENGRIAYSMFKVDGFRIDPVTGTIYTNKTIMFNPSQREMHLTLTAHDHGSPQRSAVAAVRVHVEDINNHAPEFRPASYSANVLEDAKSSSVVVTVTATDEDDLHENKVVYYSIIRGNEENMFQIGITTGEIIVVGTLDREETASYQLVVMGSDKGTPPQTSTAMVNINIVDVNDNKPKFNATEYYAMISEDAAIESTVLRVFAVDRDSGDNGKVQYFIDSGDGKEFEIDRDTGVISVRLALDYESQSSHTLIVGAKDSGTAIQNVNYATVIINISDVNEFKPKFPTPWNVWEVHENMRVGTYVGRAHANDEDAGEYGVITYSIEEENDSKGMFRIDPVTGDVTTGAVLYHNRTNPIVINIKAEDRGNKSSTIKCLIKILQHNPVQPRFGDIKFNFAVPGNAKKGYVVGQVQANSADPSVRGAIYYSLKEENEYFSINSTSGIITVIKDLKDEKQENAIDNKKRKKRFVSRMSAEEFYHHRMRRELKDNIVALTVVASCSSLSSTCSDETTIEIQVNRSCEGCAVAQTQSSGGLSGTPLVLLIVFATIAIILVVVIVAMYLRGRERKRHPPDNSQYDSSSFETIDVPPPPPHIAFAPPSYNESHPYGPHHMQNTTSEVSEPSHSASSGRGSVEGEDEDEEIRMINATPLQKQGLRMPDSGIQQDDDNISEHSVHNHQEYLARLGIDAVKINSKMNGKPPGITSSVESMHYFADEGGGEDTLDMHSLPQYNGVINGHGPASMVQQGHRGEPQDFYGDAEPSNAGSLSSVINSEEEFSGSYNWDYLLDWGPQYQPLADVFAEIARLKDDNIKPKTKPTQIVPQRQVGRHLTTQSGRTGGPPPMITDMPPRAVPLMPHPRGAGVDLPGSNQASHTNLSSSSSHSNTNSARTSQLTNVSLPKSPLSYESSFTSPAMSPSFTPSLSPLGTRSPSISPLVTPKGMASSGHSSSGHDTPQSDRPHRSRDHLRARALRVARGDSGSEQEIQI